MSRLKIFCALLSGALLAHPASAGTFRLLGFVTAAPQPLSVSLGISRDGTKATGYVHNTSNVIQGCYWDVAGASVVLHLLPNTTKAVAASDSASLVVGTFNDQAFFWNGGTNDVGSQGNINLSNVSGDGTVIVGFDRHLGNGALYFPFPGTARMLASLVPGNLEGANSVSLDGSVVVGYSTYATVTGKPNAPAFWDFGGVHRLPLITGYNSGVAASVNDQGTAALIAATSTTTSVNPAAIIVADGLVQYAQAAPMTFVSSMSDDANCFAGTWVNGTSTSFIWTRGGGFQDAATFLSTHGVGLGTNQNIQVTGVSGDGLRFSGFCTNSNSGLGEAFVATIDPIYPTITGFNISTGSVVGGNAITGSVNFSAAAPEPMYVSIAGGASALVHSLPLVGTGLISKAFPIYTSGVSSASSVVVQAYLGGHFTNLRLLLNPATMGSVSLTASSVIGGQETTGLVHLNGNSPVQGATAALSSSNTNAATVASSTFLAPNVPAPAFAIATKAVASVEQTTITATYRGIARSAVLTVVPAAFTSFHVSPTSVVGGASSTGTVGLNGVAATPVTIQLSSSNTLLAQVPPSATIPAGSSSRSFTITTKSTASDVTVTITATHGSTALKSTLLVKAVSALSVSPVPTSVRGGNSVTFYVQLSGAAPAGGAIVNMTSNGASVLHLPPRFTIAAGQTSGHVTATTSTVFANTVITVTATYHTAVSCQVAVDSP